MGHDGGKDSRGHDMERKAKSRGAMKQKCHACMNGALRQQPETV